MSVSIFIVGLLFAGATAVLASCIYNLGNKQHIVPVVAIGSIFSLIIFTLAFMFECPVHLIACLKYDHVIVMDFNISNGPIMPIDYSKVIWQRDYRTDNFYSTVIMAWNDEKLFDKYDTLVKNHN